MINQIILKNEYKKCLLFLIIGAFTSLELFSQCNLPSELPLNLADLETANRTIAECFAPTVHQMTENTENNSALGRADLITSVFYDGNMFSGDNWENLQDYIDENPSTHDELDPVVYYSVVWTDLAWFVTYAFYHPRDYAGTATCCPDNHENDLEGTVFVIDRNTKQIFGAYTISHFDLIKYNDVTSVPNIYIDNGTHAVEANIGNGCIDHINPCDNCKEFSEPHITYTLSTNGVASVSAVTSTDFNSNLEGTGSYILEDIFGSHAESLDNQRNNTSVFFGDNFVNYTEDPNDVACQYQGTASAPWGWSQMDYTTSSLENILCLAYYGYADCTLFDVYNLGVQDNPYFPTDAVNCLNDYTSDIIVSQDTEWNNSNTIETLIVMNNSTLTIKDCTIEMLIQGSVSKVDIECGSKLILDNATITGTGDIGKWKGIFVGNAASVELKNNSIVKRSIFGIYNNMNLAIDNNGGMNPFTVFTFSESAGNNSIIIDNSTLEDNFNSLTIDGDNNTIIVRNDSHINSSGYGTMIRGNENGTFEFEDSHFDQNTVSLFAYKCGNENSIYNCDFHRDLQSFAQVELREVEGLDFQMNKMEGPGSLFSAVESHVELINDNEFLNSAIGVYVGATAPLLGSATVGSIGTDANFFSGNIEGIRLHGLNSTTGGTVINNKIVNSNEIGIDVNGIGLYTINNNSIEDTNDGVYFSKSGSAMNNNINCNKFEDNDNQDLTIELDNSLTLFLQNDFSNSDNKGNIILKQASVQNLQGGLTNPSDNCFNSGSDEDLHTDGTTSTFNYFHNQDITCREPLSTGTYTKTRVAGLGANCLDGIGSNFVDINPNSGFNLAHLPDMFEPITPGILNTNVNNTLNDVIAIGGDDPYTYVDESTTNTEILPNQSYPIAYLDNIQAIYDLEEELDYWIRAGVNYAIQNEDYSYGENLLLPYKKWRWQEMLVGLYMKSKQYTKARALLTSLPSNNQYETEFKALEHINLDRLLYGEGSITSAQHTTVYNIATGITPAAGYAIPLYYILAGQHIQSTVPSKGSNKRSFARNDNDEINIIPNPVTDNLAIVKLGSKLIGDVQILDQYNRVQLSISSDNMDNVDVSNLATGWYILRGVTTESKIVTVSFIKQ